MIFQPYGLSGAWLPRRNTVIETSVAKSVCDPNMRPIAVQLAYRADEPYTVCARLGRPNEPTTSWLLSREVMLEATHTHDESVGCGDVGMWTDRHGPTFYLALRGAEGRAVLQIPLDAVEHFLGRTDMLIPFGQESTVLAPAIDRLLEDIDTFHFEGGC